MSEAIEGGCRCGAIRYRLNIVAHIWAKRKLSGIDIPAGAANWPEGAPPAEFAAVLMR